VIVPAQFCNLYFILNGRHRYKGCRPLPECATLLSTRSGATLTLRTLSYPGSVELRATNGNSRYFVALTSPCTATTSTQLLRTFILLLSSVL
jgi:hypothetical protein